MNIPQIIILALLLLYLGHCTVSLAKDTSISAGIATITMLIIVGCCAGIAAVLHAGGFW